MSQYFENDKTVIDREIYVNYVINEHEFKLVSNNGVFSKKSLDRGSKILIETILKLKLDGDILDLGCGIGVIGLTLAYFDKNNYTLSDVNARAVSLAQKNANNLNLSFRVKVIESDIFTNIKEDFDYILLNPPIRAGKKVIYQMYKDSYDHLNSGGSLFIVIRIKQGALSSYKYLKMIYKDVSIINKDKGYQIIQCQK